MTSAHWDTLIRDTNNKVKLQQKPYTLADVVDDLIVLKDRLIRHVTEEQLNAMSSPNNEFSDTPPYIILPTYKTHKDKKNNQLLYMVYGNHGEIFFTPYETLENYLLDDPNYFWNYQLKNVSNVPHNGKHAISYTFSNDKNALSEWGASLNYDEIFETYGFDGGGEKACLAGFFFIK